MERNREARRGTMAAVNGGGLSRRRQRNRDSPEENGAGELPETSRLRDRTSKRDHERDRSSRSKRRRGDRLIHGGGGREDGDDSSDESVDDEEDEEEDQSLSHRTSAPPMTMMSPLTSSTLSQQNSHARRSLPPARTFRPPPVWKVADEMIGVQVPRKARSASGKRSQESYVSSGGGSGSGEQIHCQPSTSPARPSSTSATHNSPSSSSPSVKKKLKPSGGGSIQQRLPKTASKSQSQDKIEIDVAEVLFKMARQFECNPPKQENHKLDSKDASGSINNEAKSRASSPISQPSNNALSNQGISAPKRKRPRVIKYDEESTAALPSSTAQKVEPSEQTVKSEASLPKVDKLADKCAPAPDLVTCHTTTATADAQSDSAVKLENNQKPDLGRGDHTESSEVPRPDLDAGVDESVDKLKSEPPVEKPMAKLIIDLMELPPGKSSPEREDCADYKSLESQTDLAHKMGESGRDGEKLEPKRRGEEMLPEDGKKLGEMAEDFDFKKQKNKGLDLQFDLEKTSKEIFSSCKDQNQKQQQPKASTKAEPKSDKPVSPAASMPFPMPVSGWPGNLSPFGYMGQLPPVVPLDGSSGSSKSIVPPQRLKHCATHCYIAKSIHYYQQLAKINAFWPPPAGAMQLCGGKPYNLNVVPPSESAVGNSHQGNLQGRSLSSVPEKGGSSVVSGYIAPSGGDRSSAASNSVADAQRQQLLLQQIPQPGPANTMLHGPALIFPLNQHPAEAAAVSAHPAVPKAAAGSSNASSSTANAGATNAVSGGSALNFNFTSLHPNEAQYLAILQNSSYPFPIPAHVNPYRGASPALAMPFFNGSFYSSQMIHPSQLQQQPAGQQQHPHAQQGHQNTSTSSGSSSSQKLQQNSRRVPKGGGSSATGGTSHGLPSSKQHHNTAEMNRDSSLTNDSRVSQTPKSMYGHNFAMPIHPQKFAVISPAAATSALGGTGANPNEKQHGPRAFAMSYASVPGAAPPGLDFSTISQNHPIFQSLPEAARHSYQISVSAAAAAASQTAQQKKIDHHEDGKSISESRNTSITAEDERKTTAATKGSPASGLQHSLTFSRPDSEATMSAIISNSKMDSTRTMNLIQSASSGGRVPNRNLNGVPTTSTSNTILNSPGVLQQQQQLIQLQKQQQHQLQLQHQLTTRPKSSDRMPTSSSATKFPQTLSGFPQALVQGGGSPSQSPQWKSSSRSAATPIPNPSTVSSSSKTQIPQQPSRVSLPHQPTPSHQTQISFGGNALKMSAGSMGGQCTLPSLSSATSVVVGSLANAATKGANVGSPQASSNVKSATPAQTSITLPQASDKNSPSKSSLKQSSVNSRNMPSILGQPHTTSGLSSSSSAKQQQSQTQQNQPFSHQPQLFFSGAYMPSQTSQANATAMAYYQRHQPELHSQHNNSNPSSYDPTKAIKGLPAPGLLQHPGQTGSVSPYPLITAAAGFPYINSMQSVTVKPPDQKPAAGNDTLYAPWQPEKR